MKLRMAMLPSTGSLWLGSAVLLLAAVTSKASCAGSCLSEEYSAQVTDADSVSEPAVGLMQTALYYKLREKVNEAAQGRSQVVKSRTSDSLASGAPASGYNTSRTAAVSPCVAEDLYGTVPLDLAGTAQKKVFEELGLIQKLRRTCGREPVTVSGAFLFEGAGVERQNQIAACIVLGWCVVAGGLVAWALAAVAKVPKKKDYDMMKTSLADEDKAYAKGIISWTGLGWVDELVGRYGKCWHAVIDDSEIVCNRQGEQLLPYTTFRHHWAEEVKAKGSVDQASLVAALYKTVGFKAASCVAFCILLEQMLSSVAMVFALDKLMTTLENMEAHRLAHPGDPISLLEPTVQVVLLLWGVPMLFRLASLVVCLLDGHYTNVCAAGLASIVFEKALNAPLGSVELQRNVPRGAPDDETSDLQGKDKPNIVQILNVDIVDAWANLIRDLCYTMLAPVSITVLLVILVGQIGIAGVIGALYVIPAFAIIVMSMMVGAGIWQRYQVFQDRRLKLLTETLQHIRTMKAFAWEKLSFEKIQTSREAELSCNQNKVLVEGLIKAVAHSVPWGVLLLSMWFVLGKEGKVRAHQIIVVQRIISSLLGASLQLVTGCRRMVELPNNFKRIKTFLGQPDRPHNMIRQPALAIPTAPAVRVTGSFSYIPGGLPSLRNVDVAIPRGELVGVIGAVASGKSTFLQTMLGELYPIEAAFVEAPSPESGRVAYCSQMPWIFEGTLRENIIMNSSFNQDQYFKSIHAASLTSDLTVLPGGDAVAVGTHGIRLSRGQCARVALARAAYMQQADLVLIDDPFASVDTPTAQHLCDELLLGPVMRNRTRIVVTQPTPSVLRHFDRLLLLECGQIAEMGPPDEVMESEAFRRLQSDLNETAQHTLEQPSGRSTDGSSATMLSRMSTEAASSLRESELQEHIAVSTTWWWIKAAGIINVFAAVCCIALSRFMELREFLVVAMWIDTKVSSPIAADRTFMVRTATAVLVACTCTLLSAYAISAVNITASRRIHSSIVSRLLRAPIDMFFDKQPVGRLINRLSFDMRQVDTQITGLVFGMASFTINFVLIQSYILHEVPRAVALCTIPIYAATAYFVYLYRGVSVPLVFHAKISLSALQDLHAVVIGTCVSIRANCMLEQIMVRYNHHLKSQVRSTYLVYHVCRAWVQSRVFVCFGALTGVFALGGLWSGLPMGTLSVIISLSFSQMVEFETASLGFTHLLNILTAMQRLAMYSKVPQEADMNMPNDPIVRRRVKLERSQLATLELKRASAAVGCKPGGGGPSLVIRIRGGHPLLQATADGYALELVAGCKLGDLAPECEDLQKLHQDYHILAVNNVSKSADLMARELCNPPSFLWLDLWSSEFAEGMRVQIQDLTAGYGAQKNVLHSINIDVAPRMKCCFAGKTGCGKSTTLLCMMRMLEPRDGRILIGGRDSSKMGLSSLRNIVGLMPQDPTIFEGTWRFNIDPFGEFPDARIWEALQCVQLMPHLRSLADGIDSELTRDGSNLSVGQKQLLSLARMVVRQPPVLLLDECTSALDPSTQNAVHTALLGAFPMSTVIAVAHRTETIMGFDQIAVFDAGNIVETGTVDEVMQIEGGVFASMVKASQGRST